MKKILLMSLCFLTFALISGCDDNKENGTPAEKQAQDAGSPKILTPEQIQKVEKKADDVRQDAIDQWLGKWDGAEGTYMKIEKSGDGYGITIKNLDNEERFLGVREFMRLRFHRGNAEETIYLGSGHESGMKWLENKRYCLIIKKGEAYCRDKMDD